MLLTETRTRILDGFQDPAVSPEAWALLLALNPAHSVFQTREWNISWWKHFGRGRLLLILAEQSGRPVALAPLFEDSGMIFFVGSGGSDYLDFIGDLRDAEVLDQILETARGAVPQFLGFKLYHLPDFSSTPARIKEAAGRLGMDFYEEENYVAPVLQIEARPESAEAATRKKSLVRHENYFKRSGSLEVHHSSSADEILPHLDAFFNQHQERWAVTTFPSLFVGSNQRDFYKTVAETAGPAGWLRFTRILAEGKVIAYHFGFHYSSRFLWYKPSFNIRLARHSPGEVLLRQLLLLAQKEKASFFDFGLGDEPFKNRFATRTQQIVSLGLYPRRLAA